MALERSHGFCLGSPAVAPRILILLLRAGRGPLEAQDPCIPGAAAGVPSASGRLSRAALAENKLAFRLLFLLMSG